MRKILGSVACIFFCLAVFFSSTRPLSAQEGQGPQGTTLDEKLDDTMHSMLNDVTNQSNERTSLASSVIKSILGLAALSPKKYVLFLPFSNYSSKNDLPYAKRLSSYVANGIKSIGQFTVKLPGEVRKMADEKNLIIPPSDNYQDVASFGYALGANLVGIGEVLKVERLKKPEKLTLFGQKPVYQAKVLSRVSFIDTISGDLIFQYEGNSSSVFEKSTNDKKAWKKAVRKALYLFAQKIPNHFYVRTQNIEWIGKILSVDTANRQVLTNAEKGFGVTEKSIFEVYRQRDGHLDFASGRYLMPESNKVGELEVISFEKNKALTKIKSGKGFREGFLVRLKDKH